MLFEQRSKSYLNFAFCILHFAFCILHLFLIFLPHSEQNRSESFQIERNQGIKILALSVDRFVGRKQDDDERDADKEAPKAENPRKNEEHYSQEFECVAELI